MQYLPSYLTTSPFDSSSISQAHPTMTQQRPNFPNGGSFPPGYRPPIRTPPLPSNSTPPSAPPQTSGALNFGGSATPIVQGPSTPNLAPVHQSSGSMGSRSPIPPNNISSGMSEEQVRILIQRNAMVGLSAASRQMPAGTRSFGGCKKKVRRGEGLIFFFSFSSKE